MTAKERVLASRLIQKIDNNESYARQIGLSYTVLTAGSSKINNRPIQEEEKNNDFKGE